MKLGPKKITRDMLETALAKKWDPTTTARHYGMHRTSITAACERFGIALPAHKFSPQVVSKRSPIWKEPVDSMTLEPKGKAVWSASPKAIERALQKLEQRPR